MHKIILPSILFSLLFISPAFACKQTYLIGQVGVFVQGSDKIFDNLDHPTSSFKPTVRLGAGVTWPFRSWLSWGAEFAGNISAKAPTNYNLLSLPYENKRYSVDSLLVLDASPYPKWNAFVKGGVEWIKVHYLSQGNSSNPYSYVRGYNEQGFSTKSSIGLGYDINNKTNINLAINHSSARYKKVIFGATAVMMGLKYAI